MNTEPQLVAAVSEYIRPLDEVDTIRESHWTWLERLYREDRILVSGRKQPPDGGVILFRGGCEEARGLLEGDPFVQAGVASYSLHAFIPGAAPLRSAEAGSFLERL